MVEHACGARADGTDSIRWSFGRFEHVITPTVLLFGSESPRVLRDATAAVDDALPNGRVLTLDGHGHAAMNATSDRFVEEVVAFVRESD